MSARAGDYPDHPVKVVVGYAAGSVFLAPGKTPKAVVEKLNAEIQKALEELAVAKVMQCDGYFPDHRNAAETTDFFHKEVARMEGAVRSAGIVAH